MDWCEEHCVDFITGLTPNSRVNGIFEPAARHAAELHEKHCH